jgi:hypothetical protein
LERWSGGYCARTRRWFNLEEATEISGIVPAVLALAKDPAAATAKAMKAKSFVLQSQYETMQTLANSL